MFSNDEETTLEPRIASKKSWKKEEKGLKKKNQNKPQKPNNLFLKSYAMSKCKNCARTWKKARGVTKHFWNVLFSNIYELINSYYVQAPL